MTLTSFLEALGAVTAKRIWKLTRALRFKDSSWKTWCWSCCSYLSYEKISVYQYHIEIWLNLSKQVLNSVYAHLEISSFPEVQYSSKLTNLNQRRNSANVEAVQIMHFLRIFSGIYMQLSWQAMSWLHLNLSGHVSSGCLTRSYFLAWYFPDPFQENLCRMNLHWK